MQLLDVIEAELASLAEELAAVQPGECLACYLDRTLPQFNCRGHGLTERWVAAQPRKMPALVKWLKSKGGYCDCEVVMNVFGRGSRSEKHQRLQCEKAYAAWQAEMAAWNEPDGPDS